MYFSINNLKKIHLVNYESINLNKICLKLIVIVIILSHIYTLNVKTSCIYLLMFIFKYVHTLRTADKI